MRYKLTQFKNEITDPVITIVKNTKIINYDLKTASCEVLMITLGAKQSHTIEDVDVSGKDLNNLDWESIMLPVLDENLLE